MKDVKITVVDTALNQDLVDQYGIPGTTRCPKHKVGDVFIAKGGEKPDGFCDEAWNSVTRYAISLSAGATHFWEDWAAADKTALATCADGFRPVAFLMETIDN